MFAPTFCCSSRFWSLHASKPPLGQAEKSFWANRSSSRVQPNRNWLTMLRPSTELSATFECWSRSHSRWRPAGVTARLLVWPVCGDHSPSQRTDQLWLPLIWWSKRVRAFQARTSVTRRPVQIGPRRNLDRPALVDPDALDVGEEVGLVLDHRAADGAAVLALLGVGLFEVVLIHEEVLGAHRLVRVEHEPRAVERVGARLGHRVDDRAGGAAELGVVLPDEDLRLLHALDRHAHLAAVVLAQVVVVVPGAVDEERVVARVHAVGRDRLRAPRRQVRHLHDPRQQGGEAEPVARDARQLGQVLGVEIAADLLRGHVDDRRLARHRDRLFQRAQLEADRHRRRRADDDRQIASQEALEAGSAPPTPDRCRA